MTLRHGDTFTNVGIKLKNLNGMNLLESVESKRVKPNKGEMVFFLISFRVIAIFLVKLLQKIKSFFLIKSFLFREFFFFKTIKKT